MTAARIQEFDFSVNLLRALLWQYEEAVNLRSLLFAKANWYADQQTEFWRNWETDVFDLNTANDFGLSVWSIILNIPLYYGIAGTGPRGVWGFGQYNYNFTPDRPPLNIGYNFGRDGDAIAKLSTEQKRLILKLRYYQITSDGTPADANRAMKVVFGDMGGTGIIDSNDMSEVTYVLEFQPTSAMLTVLEKFDVLPRPAAVGRKVLVNPRGRFGFKPYYLNFENSNFGGEKLRTDIPAAPAQFTTGQWSFVTGDAQGELKLTITTLPADGGEPITSIIATVDDVDHVIAAEPGTVIFPGFTTGDTITASVAAVNTVGVGPDSAIKSAVVP